MDALEKARQVGREKDAGSGNEPSIVSRNAPHMSGMHASDLMRNKSARVDMDSFEIPEERKMVDDTASCQWLSGKQPWAAYMSNEL